MWKTWSKNRGRWEQLTLSVRCPLQVGIRQLQTSPAKVNYTNQRNQRNTLKKHTHTYTHLTLGNWISEPLQSLADSPKPRALEQKKHFCQSNELHWTAYFHLQSAQSKVALFRRQSCKFGSTSKRVDFEQLHESGCRLTQHWAAIHSCAHLVANTLDFESYQAVSFVARCGIVKGDPCNMSSHTFHCVKLHATQQGETLRQSLLHLKLRLLDLLPMLPITSRHISSHCAKDFP